MKWLSLLLLAALQFSSGVNLVEVYVTVTDPSGQPVTGLPLEAFSIFEDGQLQEVSTFVAGEFPLSVALAVDRSFSMTGERLNLALAGARAFLSDLRADDRAMLIGISSETEVVTNLTTNRVQLLEDLKRLTPWGTTALHDAIVDSLDLIRPQQGRRALVMLSDGTDRFSRTTASTALEHARRSNVLVYPVAVGNRRPPLFAELAAATGGRSIHVPRLETLSGRLKEVARELRYQYLLGYTPRRALSSSEPEEWRAIAVKVDRPGVKVRARDGYRVQGSAFRVQSADFG